MRRTLTLVLIFAFTTTLLAACAEDKPAEKSAYASEKYAEDSSANASANADLDASILKASDEVDAVPKTGDARKIIYNANVSLVVDQFDGVPARVNALAKQHNGFVASSSIQGNQGQPRQGEWTLRIASTRYDAFLHSAETLGQLRSINSDSQEVTAEYVDLQARIKNLKAQEARLHKHLSEDTSTLKDILTVEREIARVRGDIERIEGRLNVLKDLTALSTVTLSIEEIKDFVPSPTQEPGFATQIGRTWAGSIDAVGGFLTGLSLAIVGLTPWLVVLIPLGLIGYLITRSLRRHLKNNKAPHAKQTAT